MKLRHQLLCVSVFMLSVPWAGYQYINEIEFALRQGQERSLLATAQAAAAVLAEQPDVLYPLAGRLHEEAVAAQSLYFERALEPIVIDGYADEWRGTQLNPVDQRPGNNPNLHYRGVIHADAVSLFITVKDDAVVFHNPSLPEIANGDRLVLVTDNRQRFLLTTSAPGSMQVRRLDASRPQQDGQRIRAVWQDIAEGYQIELSIPLSLLKGRLGFYLMDDSEPESLALGTLRPGESAAWIVFPPNPLRQQLQLFQREDVRLRVVDTQNWQLADVAGKSSQTIDNKHWLTRALYRSIVGRQVPLDSYQDVALGRLHRREIDLALRGSSSGRWYHHPAQSNQQLISVGAPIVGSVSVLGAVIAEQSSEQTLALAGHAFNRLLLYSLVALGATGVGLFGYAGWLSWRVQKLSRAARNVVAEDGALLDNFPRSGAGDEIGQLSRSYADMIKRIREYNDYLQTLSRKLAHELRTPLAVVRTSLDNLQNQALDDASKVYQRRAREGVKRLSQLLTSMSEASRVEESIQSAEPVSVVLPKLIEELGAAYKDVYRNHQIETVVLDTGEASTNATLLVPELIVQMLDKLMDNAADFAPPGSRITLAYARTADGQRIEVSNVGPTLPDTMQEQLFDNLVSLREGQGDQPHLGLGLHIVRLIAAFHGASVKGFNLEDRSGVCFQVLFPV